jgi:hypothetical protein
MAACIASARVAEWETEPLLPWAVIVKLPVATLDDAPKTTAVLAPDAMLKGLEGFETTPLGTPDNVTWTVPVKPFCPTTETVMGAVVPPCARESEVDESVIAKSGDGGAGGCTFADEPLPPPHPAQASSKGMKMLLGARFLNCPTVF